MSKRKKLRSMLQGDKIIVAPGVYDAIGAKLVERVGFEAVYITGFGVSASLIGQPDLGLITLTELATHAKNIDSAVTLPVIADAESGFGNALNVARAIREYEKAGVAALHIEDQIVPKRYKPDGMPQVVSMEEHVNKIKSAVEARTDENLVIIARTDALGRYGLKEAIKRGNAYSEAGGDMVFVHGAKTLEELETIAREIQSPNLVNYSTLVESGMKPLPSVPQLEEIGFKIVILGGELLFSAVKTMKEMLEELKSAGTLNGWLNKFVSVEKFLEIMELCNYIGKEKRYLPGDDIGK